MLYQKKRNKKGQIQVTFNWIYILIAGAVILLFFIGIVVRQKAVSEERLAVDVVEIMQSIFTSAGVSEKTKNVIDTSGLIDYTFYFSCFDQVSEYGIEGSSAGIQNNIDPVFAPSKLQTSSLITWSLPYLMPYKVTDFLFITSSNTKYVVLGNSQFAEEFIANTEEFNVVNSLENLDAGNNFQVRVVDTLGTFVTENQQVPEGLLNLDDDKVTAVRFESDAVSTRVYYYQKDGDIWRLLNPNQQIPIVSLEQDRDAARYAAVFAADHEMYWCNMQKAFNRLQLVNDIYLRKLNDLEQFYQQQAAGICLGYVSGNIQDSLKIPLQTQGVQSEVCSRRMDCLEFIQSSSKIRDVNDLMQSSCVALY